MDKLERLLNLTAALLNTSQPLSAAELRERLGKGAYADNRAAFRRTFERDKADLRAIGVPLEVSTLHHVEPPVEGYRIRRRDYAGRDLRFEPDELAVLHMATSIVRVAGSDTATLAKLGGLDTSKATAYPVATADPTLAAVPAATADPAATTESAAASGSAFAATTVAAADPASAAASAATTEPAMATEPAAATEPAMATEPAAATEPAVTADPAATTEPVWAETLEVGQLPFHAVLSELVVAAAAGRTVSFAHRGSVREVEPWRLSFNRGNWYLVGFDRERNAARLFRVDRIDSSVTHVGPAHNPVGHGPDPGALKPWEFGVGEPVHARVLVDADQAAWACHNAGSDGEPQPDGSVVLTLAVRDPASFRTFVLSLLEHAEVLEPQWLRDQMVEWLQNLA